MAMSFPGCSLSLETSSPTPSLASLVLPTTLSSVVENTTFGRAFQIWANSTCSGAAGYHGHTEMPLSPREVGNSTFVRLRRFAWEQGSLGLC